LSKNLGDRQPAKPVEERIALKDINLNGSSDSPDAILVESVRKYKGVLVPILVMQKGSDKYEVIEGYGRQRVLAAKESGYENIRAIVINGMSVEQLDALKIEHVTKANLATKTALISRLRYSLGVGKGRESMSGFEKYVRKNVPGVSEVEMAYALRLSDYARKLVDGGVMPLEYVDTFSDFDPKDQDDIASAAVMGCLISQSDAKARPMSLRKTLTELTESLRDAQLLEDETRTNLYKPFAKALSYRCTVLAKSMDALSTQLEGLEPEQATKALKPVTDGLYSFKKTVDRIAANLN
jgi:hypothetical protein